MAIQKQETEQKYSIAKEIKVIDDFRYFVDDLFSDAIKKGASDIHIEPHKDKLIIRYRIDGDLYHIYTIDKSNQENLIARIKILARLKIDEKRLPQDGQIVFQYREGMNIEDVDMRVSTFPTLYGEKIVLRILRKDMSLLNLDKLGFLSVNLNLIKKAMKFKEGLVLVSWPTGSGKTTTLYAMLNYFNPMEYNISTLEDPVEYKLEGVAQSQVNHEIGYTFANWLKTLLRQDPDIILVWEIRDYETAKLAVEASLTWHLVFGTIHANQWVGVVERLINMWVDKYLVASSLKMILAQRLVKKLCSCAVPAEMDAETQQIFKEGLGDIYEELKPNASFKVPKWCDKCLGSWFKWRVGLHEVVLIDQDFSKLISTQVTADKWEEVRKSKGYLSLYQDGLIKVLLWITNLQQVLPYKSL